MVQAPSSDSGIVGDHFALSTYHLVPLNFVDKDDTFRMVIASEDTEMEMRQSYYELYIGMILRSIVHIPILKQVTRNSGYTTNDQSEHMIQILKYLPLVEFSCYNS
ncbi:hypothetical protein EPI10_013299 [Gossypium australe]|uniref:Uncharacterized protein n=1 Tax=Gossypium australe TaxID=47621 RepID=A0A5B6ULK7_9ROSI|nr:hypothetical protein EPI10_013299 [Gossypium australe]